MQGCTADIPDFPWKPGELDPAVYPIRDDRQFFLELLRATRVMLVQGTGFNWVHPDHFRIVFLPHEDDLREAIGRIAKFLEDYRKSHGTDSATVAATAASTIKLVAANA